MSGKRKLPADEGVEITQEAEEACAIELRALRRKFGADRLAKVYESAADMRPNGGRLRVLVLVMEDDCALTRWSLLLKPETVKTVFCDSLKETAEEYLTAIAYAEDPEFAERTEKEMQESDYTYDGADAVFGWMREHCVKDESEENGSGWWNVTCASRPLSPAPHPYDRVYTLLSASLAV